MIDVAIIGGGPAGAAAAIEARRRGLRVSVWERDRFPRDKVCGEFLSAESLPLLAAEIPATLARGALIRRCEFVSPSGHASGFNLPRPGRGLSRRLLDEALWRAAAAAGAETRQGEGVSRLRKLEAARKTDASWEIENEMGVTQRARALIIACGRWWTLEGIPSPARQEKKDRVGRWLGVKAHFRGVASRDAVEMYYFPGGYCGLAPIEDGLYNACCLIDRRLVRDASVSSLSDFAAWLKLVARQPALDARLRGAEQSSETLATAPFRPGRRRATCDGALLAGDAAGVIDPFTGDGIARALHSGRLAAEVWVNNWPVKNREYASVAGAYRRQLGRAVRRSYLVAGLLRPLVRAPARVQTVGASALSWLGARLFTETRWRPCREIAESTSRI